MQAARQHSWFSAAAAVGGATLLLLGAARGDAATISELNGQIASAQSEAQGLAADIEVKTAALADAHASAQAAAAREAELAAVLAQGREREAELAVRVTEAEQRLREVRERLNRALVALGERLVAIYKGDDVDPTALILSANGFDDLATRAEYLHAIQEADADLAARVRELREQVEAQLAAVEAARAEQAAFNRRTEAAHDQIAAARAQAEARAAQLDAARAAQASALAALRSQVGAWTAQVQELQQVSAAEAQQQVASWVGDYAIPQSIVMCESGGNYDAVNPDSGAGGAYQILPSTWELYGGSGQPHTASRAEQDRIASQIWQDSGSSAWVCAG